MLFNSFPFLLAFLPIVLAGFFLVGRRLGRGPALAWLVAASLFFYGYWEPAYLWLLAGSMVFNYGAARWIAVASRGRGWITGIAVVANVLVLFYYKLIVANLIGPDGTPQAAFSTVHDVLIPLGISFITFQQIAFLIDTYHDRLERHGVLEYMLFITFFPQLVMGPIVHYRELAPQLRAPDLLSWRADNFSVGLSIFIVGLFKKVVLADSLAPFVDEVYRALSLGREISPSDAWAAAAGFPLQLYFDFSGYADMAVGLARMFNIHLPLNFDSPYRSVDRFDQWRRWHISFGAFMRQYVFFPLARSKRLGVGNLGALMLTTVISGAWHGVGPTFIVWGAMQGLFMAALHYRREWLKRLGIRTRSRKDGVPWTSMVITFFVTCCLGVFFRSSELAVAFSMFGNMFDGVTGLAAGRFASSTLLQRSDVLLLALMAVIVWGMPSTQRFFGTFWKAIDQRASPSQQTVPDLLPGAQHLRFSPSRIWAAAMALMLVAALSFMDTTSRFVYYQF